MSHRHQASFVSRIPNLHVGRIGVASALAGSLLLGCSNQQVKVEMVAGEAGPERIFETNRTNRDEIGRLSEAYETAPMERAGGRDGGPTGRPARPAWGSWGGAGADGNADMPKPGDTGGEKWWHSLFLCGCYRGAAQ